MRWEIYDGFGRNAVVEKALSLSGSLFFTRSGVANTSLRICLLVVALRCMMGTCGNASRNQEGRSESFRKPCPHSEMQQISSPLVVHHRRTLEA